MIGYWHSVPMGAGRPTRSCLEAHLGGYELVVESGSGREWFWRVVNLRGHEIESGLASDQSSAEQDAEEAAFHIHPPTVGDWVARLL